MKALITGIDGFVGRYLAEYLLNQNIDVYGTGLNELNEKNINKDLETYKMDVTDKSNVKELLEKIRPDYIFHLAAQSSAAVSWKNPQLTMDVNIKGTINILDTMRELDLNSRILLIGSSEEYGFVNVEDIPVDENQSLKPANPYAVSKIAQSMIGQVYAKAYDMDIVMVRAFNHIGPRQSPTFVTSDFAKRIAQIEKGTLEATLLVGNLEAERDFTDVRDIVRGYYEIIEKGKKGEVYNIGSGQACSIQYILDYLIDISNMEIEVEKDPNRMRPSDAPIIQCDNSKFVDVTKWEPEYKIQQTLNDILDYWREIV